MHSPGARERCCLSISYRQQPARSASSAVPCCASVLPPLSAASSRTGRQGRLAPSGQPVTPEVGPHPDGVPAMPLQHHISNPFGNIIGLCQCPDVDLVSVVSPTYLHSEQMIGARPSPHRMALRCRAATRRRNDAIMHAACGRCAGQAAQSAAQSASSLYSRLWRCMFCPAASERGG